LRPEPFAPRQALSDQHHGRGARKTPDERGAKRNARAQIAARLNKPQLHFRRSNRRSPVKRATKSAWKYGANRRSAGHLTASTAPYSQQADTFVPVPNLASLCTA
jgi:hypothetical protein